MPKRRVPKKNEKLVEIARNAGKTINNVWEKFRETTTALVRSTTHEKRIRRLEEDIAEHSKSINSLMRWLEDHENRVALLEHFEGYDLSDVNCKDCGSAMRVKRNRQSNEFFLGCINYRANSETGKAQCQGRKLSKYDLQMLAKRLQSVA